MVRKSQEIRKIQEKLRKMTKVRKKKTDFVSSNLPNSLYFKASDL